MKTITIQTDALFLLTQASQKAHVVFNWLNVSKHMFNSEKHLFKLVLYILIWS